MTAPRTPPKVMAGRLLAAGALLCTLAAARAQAGTIGFSISTSVTTAAGISVEVTLTNNGDEAAFSVTPTVELSEIRRAGETEKQIAPGSSRSWKLPVSAEAPPPGARVAVIRVSYEDANGYPFEVLTAAPFRVAAKPRPPVRGKLRIPPVAVNGSVRGFLTLTMPRQRGQKYEIEVVAPSGLNVETPKRRIEIGANRGLRLPVDLRNKRFLKGTRVDVLALVRSLEETPTQTDVVHGTVSIGAVATGASKPKSLPILAGLAILLLLLEIVARFYRITPSGPLEKKLSNGISAALILLTTGFLLSHYPWKDLLAGTVTSGGDMASLFYPTKLMAEEILPRGELTGWTMGNYARFPVFHFYSTLPFAVIALIGKLLPMEQTFKLVTLIGPTFLPLAAAWLFRVLGYRRSDAAVAAVSVLPFLLQQGNSMWGGNIPSVLAGEFCHAIGLTLSLVFLGVLRRCVEGRSHWPLAALILAAIGLTHTFAFFAAFWCSLFFLWPQRDLQRSAAPLLATYAVTFLLLCFWGVPLPTRLVFTSEWSMIWRIKDWREVLPTPLWPAAGLAAAGLLASLLRVKEFLWHRQGLLLFTLGGGVLLYFLVPALGFPDIRFVPVAQLFLCLLAADTVAWIARALRFHAVFAGLIVAAGLAWGQAHLGYIPSWLHWNYAGYENKATWGQFKKINDHVAGDLNDSRVVFEHSQTHNRFGSSRAFENLPLFSGRSTLEGVFHQASLNSPFIFYLQSEVSERGSGPFPQYTYTRLNPAAALPHLRLYNVGQLVVVSEKAKAAYDADANFTKSFHNGAYAVYDVRGGDTGYVIAANNQPVLYQGSDWKLAFYRWFKHPELLDIPLVPETIAPSEEARQLALRTDSVTRLPREPIAGTCNVSSHLEQYRIDFETSCPGRPHIVKVSYFPRWHAADGSPVLPVSPGFMLVYPRGSSTTLLYRRNPIDWIALLLSLGGLVLLVGCWTAPQLRKRFADMICEPFSPLLASLERHRRPASLLLLLLLIAAAWTTRVTLRSDFHDYTEAQEAYRARDFEKAIPRLEAFTAEDKDTFKQATALYQLGISYGELGMSAAAALTHERLRFEFPNVNYGAGTLFHLARNYHRLESDERARQLAAELIRDFPDSGWRKRLEREIPEILPERVQ